MTMQNIGFSSAQIENEGFDVIVTPEGARRQFRISVALLLCLAFGAAVVSSTVWNEVAVPSATSATSVAVGRPVSKATALDARTLYAHGHRSLADNQTGAKDAGFRAYP